MGVETCTSRALREKPSRFPVPGKVVSVGPCPGDSYLSGASGMSRGRAQTFQEQVLGKYLRRGRVGSLCEMIVGRCSFW